MAFGFKMLLHEVQLVDLVLYKKNRGNVPGRWVCCGFFLPLCRGQKGSDIARHRQIQVKRRTPARLARYIDEPAVVGHDAVNHRETEAAALSLGLGCKKRLENTILDRLIYIIYVIRHACGYILSLPGFLKMPA